MITVIHRKRLESLTPREFARACRKLGEAWQAAHCPEPDDMPRWMLHEWVALKVEGERRGFQMTLF